MEKKNVSRFDKRDQFEYYKIAKSNLSKVKHRFSLSRIIRAVLEIPKFDIFVENYDVGCFNSSNTKAVYSYTEKETSSTYTPSGSSVIKGYVPFSIGVIAGMPNAPQDDTNAWQSDSLKGALNLTSLILNDTNLTLAAGDFTFDNTTGIISMPSNKFFTGDVLVGTYFKLI